VEGSASTMESIAKAGREKATTGAAAAAPLKAVLATKKDARRSENNFQKRHEDSGNQNKVSESLSTQDSYPSLRRESGSLLLPKFRSRRSEALH
jgi:hypothetical protein